MSKAAEALRAIKGGTDTGKATALPSIPNVPRTDDARVNQFLSAIKQTLETWGGDRGNSLDSAVTWRELIEKQFAKVDETQTASSIVPSWFGQNGSVQGTDSGFFGIPPAPTGLTAEGAFANIILSWDAPPYGNHSYTEIWRSSVNNLGTAQLVGMAAGAVYVDNVGGNASYYYWLKFVSTSAVKGPFNATEGVLGKTSLDPAFILETLSGQLHDSQLNKDLSGRIELITADASVPGSVNARISETQQELINETDALAQEITTLSASTEANASAIQTEATARSNGDQSNAELISQVQARLDTGDYAAVKEESSATASAVDGIEAKYSVKTDVNGYVSGFGLISTANNATPFSQFIFKADQFGFGAPGLASAYPFVIQATATTVNGVAVPAGVYIDAAYIENGTITSAKIGNAAIDNAKIADLAVDNANIADLAVTNGKIANLAVDSAKIANLAVTNGKIANLAVTNAKIDDLAVSTLKIAGNAVTQAVTAQSLGDKSVPYLSTVTVLTTTVTLTGTQPVLVMLTSFVGGGLSGSQLNSNTSGCIGYVEIDGVQQTIIPLLSSWAGNLVCASGAVMFSGISAGTKTLYVKFYCNTVVSPDQGIFVRDPRIVVLETKR